LEQRFRKLSLAASSPVNDHSFPASLLAVEGMPLDSGLAMEQAELLALGLETPSLSGLGLTAVQAFCGLHVAQPWHSPATRAKVKIDR